MPLNTIPLPFGARDLKVRPLVGETPGASVDLPNLQLLQFAEAEEMAELRGDDGIVAIHGKGPLVDWQVDGGGISFEAVAVVYGGTLSTTGVTPNQVKTWTKLANQIRPYFQIEGQAISDSGGDVHVLLYRCRATGNFSGQLQDMAFWVSKIVGRALGRSSDQTLYSFIQNETQAPIT